MIDFDYANLLSDVVGAENGVSRAEIEQERETAHRALESFRKKIDSGRYGFPHLPFRQEVIKEIRTFAASCAGRFHTICLVGIGGSALGAWALDCALRGPHPVQPKFSRSNPRLVILDNVDPAFITAALESMDPRRTLAVAITKSGSTAESIATYLVIRAWLEKSVGAKNLPGHLVAITEPESATGKRSDLLEIARREQCQTFYLPENVGGRFSVLSPVGLAPAALIGIDIRTLCAGARDMTHLCWQADLEQNHALLGALLHWILLERRHKSIQVAFSYSNLLWGMAFWFRQLWAESLGKNGRGQTPIAALGVTDQHSQVQLYLDGPNDKVFTLWAAEPGRNAVKIPRTFSDLASAGYLGGQTIAALFEAERKATAAALARKQRPNCTLTMAKVDTYHVGAFLQMMEFQVAFMGELMGIDAFDQPGVELGKRLTYTLMGREGFEEYHRQLEEYEELRRRAIHKP